MLLDANILFLPVRNGFPLDQEVDRLRPGAIPAVPASVLSELDRLVERGTRDAAAARAVAGRYLSVPSRGRGDDAILHAALREHATVATADRGLRSRLLARGVEVLSPRDRHRLHLYLARVPPRRAGRVPANR